MSTSTNSIAITRLAEERKQWRKEHPFGFFAKPLTNADGTLNLLEWDCGIPGKAGTPWEGGLYKLHITFPSTYPSAAPKCQFKPPIPHPNIFVSGTVCLSLLSEWRPSMTLKQLLLGIQQMLDEPNLKSPANQEFYDLLRQNPAKYRESVLRWAAAHKP